MPRSFVTARRGLVASVMTVLVATTALAACSEVRDGLDAADHERFVDASNRLVEAFDQLDAKYVALGSGELEVPAFVEAAEEDIETMSAQVDDLEELAGSISGDAQEIAEAAVSAAQEVITATREIVAAIAAGDEAALEAGIAAADDAVDAFNVQIDAWNDL